MKFPAYTSPQLRSTLPHPYLRPSAPGTSTALLPVKSSAPANTTRMSPSGNTSPESRRCNPGASAAPGNPNPAISEKSPPMAMYAPARNASRRVLPAGSCILPKGSETIRNAQADAVSLPGIFFEAVRSPEKGQKRGIVPEIFRPDAIFMGLKLLRSEINRIFVR